MPQAADCQKLGKLRFFVRLVTKDLSMPLDSEVGWFYPSRTGSLQDVLKFSSVMAWDSNPFASGRTRLEKVGLLPCFPSNDKWNHKCLWECGPKITIYSQEFLQTAVPGLQATLFKHSLRARSNEHIKKKQLNFCMNGLYISG